VNHMHVYLYAYMNFHILIIILFPKIDVSWYVIIFDIYISKQFLS
jgi:hypothetical protein